MSVQKRKKATEVEKEPSAWSRAFSAGSKWDEKVSINYVVK